MNLPLLAGGRSLQLSTADGLVGGKVWPAASALCQFLLLHYHHRQQRQQQPGQQREPQKQFEPQRHPQNYCCYDAPSSSPPSRLDCVELGSGTGAVGLYAGAALGCRVTLTEHRPPLTSVLTSVPYAPDGTPEWTFLADDDDYGGGSGNDDAGGSDFYRRKSRRLLELLEENIRQNVHLFSRQPPSSHHQSRTAGGHIPRVLELDWNDPHQARQVAAASQSGHGYDLVLASDVTYFSQLHQPLADTIATVLSKQKRSTRTDQTSNNNEDDDDKYAVITPKCFVSHQERLINLRGLDSHLIAFEEALTKAGLAIVEKRAISNHNDIDDDSTSKLILEESNLQNQSRDNDNAKVCILEIQHC